MSLVKVSKDYAVKLLGGKNVVPSGLVDLQKYFKD
jgi:ribosome biogenesis SPOUT family RNA methylase Rps3